MLDFQKVFSNERNRQEKAITQTVMKEIEESARKALEAGRTEKEKDIPISREEFEKRVEMAKDAYINSNTLQALDGVVKKSIGQRMMKIREEKRKSQDDVIADFAFVPDMSKSVLSRWENGVRGINFFFLLWFIAEYDVDLQYLLTGEKREPSNSVVPELQKKLEEALELSRKL